MAMKSDSITFALKKNLASGENMAESRNQRRTHPYARWEGTPLWKAIDKGIADLVGNNDIIEKADRKYIVGYLCKAVNQRRQRVIAQLTSEDYS